MANTTENKYRVKNPVTKRSLEEYSLSKTLVSLMWEEPFYSRIIRSLNKVEDESIPTAGVLIQQGNPTMLWNREFMVGLKPIQRKGLIKHECLHIVFGHISDRIRKPHIIWNWSTDLAINSLIPENELPEGGLIPGKPLPDLTNDQINMMTDEEIKNHHKISNLIKSLPPEKTSEFYFDVLMSSKEMQELAQQMEGDEGIGLGGGGNGKLSDIYSNLDSHEGWSELSDEEREIAKSKIEEILKSASKECNTGKGWGSVPNSLRQQIGKMLSKEVKWESILSRFCGSNVRAQRTSSIRRANKKYPGVHPGFNKIYKPIIAVYLDESGSVDNKFLSKIFSEIENLSKKTDFYLYRFDTRVHEASGFLWKKGKRIDLQREKCGGTCFNAPTKHALKNKSKIDGYIIITDGLAPKPEISKGMKRCWILSENDNLNFQKDKKDFLVKVKV